MTAAPPPSPAPTPTPQGGAPLIYSGQWLAWPDARDYRAAQLGDILAERLVWGPRAALTQRSSVTIAGPGYIWFRFWLPRDMQVVAKYFDNQGQALGMQIDVCLPPVHLPAHLRAGPFAAAAEPLAGWFTTGLVLDIWISSAGQVTVRHEAAFEQAVRDGELTAAEAAWAEERVRTLTSAIARRRFPPALVRNWQIDVRQVQETLTTL